MDDAEIEMSLYEGIRKLWTEIDAQARVTAELLLEGDVHHATIAAKEYGAMTARQTNLEELAFHLSRKRETEGSDQDREQ